MLYSFVEWLFTGIVLYLGRFFGKGVHTGIGRVVFVLGGGDGKGEERGEARLFRSRLWSDEGGLYTRDWSSSSPRCSRWKRPPRRGRPNDASSTSTVGLLFTFSATEKDGDGGFAGGRDNRLLASGRGDTKG